VRYWRNKETKGEFMEGYGDAAKMKAKAKAKVKVIKGGGPPMEVICVCFIMC
jgi:hypothetical protein